MDKIWLKSYPKGMPETIELDRYTSLAELFKESCERYADKPAYANFGTQMSYAELNVFTHDFAAYCQQVLGLKPGERLAIMLPNVMQYPISVFGAFKAGLIVVNVNPLYTSRELEHQLRDSGAVAIVILENVAHVLEPILANTSIKHVITSKIGDCLPSVKGSLMHLVVKYIKRKCPAFSLPKAISFKTVLGQGSGLCLTKVSLKPEDIAFLQYTGGTTGLSKGVELTHRNLVSNVEQAYQWINSAVETGKEVIITALPLYHIFSLTANCLTFLKLGALNVLVTNPRDMPGFVKILKQYRFSIMTGVNTLFNGLLNEPTFSQVDFSHFKVCLGGGMAVQESVARRWKSVTGVALAEAYGLTETSPAAMINPVNLSEYNGSIGLPIASTEVKVIDEAGQELPVDESGELCVRGPQVMKGYWHNKEATDEVLDSDGWLRTGDIARIDEQGYVYIVDRKKDMILVSGFNVYPNEVEEVMSAHKQVLEVAVVGVGDDKCGEVVKAFVVAKDPSLTAEGLIQYCRTALTAYKVPKAIEFREELPKTNVGKILRKALREETA